MTPSEALAHRYAGNVISLFGRIAGDWRALWISGGLHPQQDMDGIESAQGKRYGRTSEAQDHTFGHRKSRNTVKSLTL